MKAIPEAPDVIHDIAKLVVESAAVFDQHVKYNIAGKYLDDRGELRAHVVLAAKAAIASVSKAHHKRVSECDEKLKTLRKKLTETLVIRIWQGQNRLLERSMTASHLSEVINYSPPSSRRWTRREHLADVPHFHLNHLTGA